MLPALERLLILQDRDRRITRVRSELGNIDFERQAMRSRAHASQARLEEAKHKSKQIESERKRQIEAQQMISIEQAMALMGLLIQSVREHVRDADTLRAVTNEFMRLTARPAPGADC